LAGTGYVGFDTWQNNVYLDDAYAGTISAAATSTVILPATRRGGFPALITM
jgi:hypothetical protein